MLALRIAGCLLAGTVLAACSGAPQPSLPVPSAATSAPSPGASSPAPASSAPASATPTPSPSQSQDALELPRGGREIFPRYRLFGYSGYPGAPGQGRLGIGSLDARMKEMEQRGQAFRGGRELMPVMELIATTVHGSPGKDGMFRSRVEESVIKQWMATADKHKAMLLLNIQPGRADFLDEVKYFEKWLKYPNVGVALDPEWAVDAGQIPGRVFGSTTGKELNAVATYLSELVSAHNLPEKVMLFHQLNLDVLKRPKDMKEHEGLVYINSVDGIGSPGAKIGTYQRVIKTRPSYVHAGFKLFYIEDKLPKYNGGSNGRIMTAKEVLRLKPQPEYILFE